MIGNNLAYFMAGMMLYAVGSCTLRPEYRIYEKRGTVHVRLDGEEYAVTNNQLGSVDHRVRGLLDESPSQIRRAIEDILQEEQRK
jgi:hypothetical protein